MTNNYGKANIPAIVLLIMFCVTTIGYGIRGEQIQGYKTEISKLEAKIETLQKYQDNKPAIISCANSEKDYLKTLRRTELKYKIPKGLLTQVAYVESNFDAKAVSHKGAVGIMQIVPRWHPEVNARDPYDAIPYSAKYLIYLKKRFGSWELALAAWNWGEGNMTKYSFYEAPRETRNFVKKVMQKVRV